MSIPVSVDRLAEALADFGAGYLLSASSAGRVKVVTVEPTVVDGALLVTSPGRGTVGNVAGNPQVTLAFPPTEPRGFTLLVDGIAELRGRISGSLRRVPYSTGRRHTATARRPPAVWRTQPTATRRPPAATTATRSPEPLWR